MTEEDAPAEREVPEQQNEETLLSACTACGRMFAPEFLTPIRGGDYCSECRDIQISMMLQSIRTEGGSKPSAGVPRIVYFTVAFVMLAFVLMLVPLVFLTSSRVDRGPVDNMGKARTDVSLVRVQLLRMARHLDEHFLERRQYPRRLEELALEDPSLATDPFQRSGRPFRYRRPGPLVYMIYSLGPDRNDDGGKPLQEDRGDGDLVVSGRMGRSTPLGGNWPSVEPLEKADPSPGVQAENTE